MVYARPRGKVVSAAPVRQYNALSSLQLHVQLLGACFNAKLLCNSPDSVRFRKITDFVKWRMYCHCRWAVFTCGLGVVCVSVVCERLLFDRIDPPG